jgi:hypothetical protein
MGEIARVRSSVIVDGGLMKLQSVGLVDVELLEMDSRGQVVPFRQALLFSNSSARVMSLDKAIGAIVQKNDWLRAQYYE